MGNPSPQSDRQKSASAAAATLERARDKGEPCCPTLAGFDVCVDSIIRVVRRRSGPGPSGFEAMDSMTELARKIGDASGRSANIELVVERRKIGGNAVIMAGALASLGAPVSFIGNLDTDEATPSVHPVFQDFAARCRDALSLGPVGFTDALEFNDGKLLLGKVAGLDSITWEAVLRVAGGVQQLATLVERSRLFAMGNWTMTAGMTEIWRALAESVFPLVKDAGSRRIFVDLADPAKRSDDDLAGAIEQLQAMNRRIPLTLGLNISEAGRVLRLCGAEHRLASDSPSPEEAALAAASILEKLGLARVCVHHRRGAGAATASGDSAGIEGPFVAKPKISTGAGDHFNAGFAFAMGAGADVAQCLASAVAVSGYYIRTGASPTLDQLIDFLRELPEPER